MSKYCLVNVIKPECLNEYVNAHLNPWEEVLDCLKNAGTKEELIYMYKNFAIIFIDCESMDTYMEKFANSEIGKKWFIKVAPWFEDSEFSDADGKPKDSPTGLEKVFDLNQQLKGSFNKL